MFLRRLPDEIILRIFTFLEDRDLVNASSTCLRWRRIYYDPVLWKSRTFELRGYARSHPERLNMLTKYVKSMGEHLKHVRIVCPSPNLLTAYNVAKCVEKLLHGLSCLERGKEKITSFEMSHLHFEDSWSGFRCSTWLLVNSVSEFLETQENLVSFNMAGSFVTPPFSYRILKSVARSRSVKRLQFLNIVNYYSLETSLRIIGCQLRTVSTSCYNLREIALNYSYLHVANVVDICENLAGCLRTLTLYVTLMDFSSPAWAIISSDRWRLALKACPGLGVKIEMVDWPLDPTAVLVPGLPLTELSIRGSQCPRSVHSFGSKTSNVLDHCAIYFALSIQAVSFLVDGEVAMSHPKTASLLNFIKKCKKLRSLLFSDTLVNCDYLAKIKANACEEEVTISIITV